MLTLNIKWLMKRTLDEQLYAMCNTFIIRFIQIKVRLLVNMSKNIYNYIVIKQIDIFFLL